MKNILQIIMIMTSLSFFGQTTVNDGDWSEKSVLLQSTPEADLMVRTGDIDNLGFGWRSGFDPFSGNSAGRHRFPWTPEVDDPIGTDRIMVVTSYDGTNRRGRDGYTTKTNRPDNNVVPITLNYTTSIPIRSAKLQMFLDDFQASSIGTVYQVFLDDIRDSRLENLINELRQTGPIGKIVTYDIPDDLLYLLDDGKLALKFDDLTTGTGDGYAIDFIKLLINPKEVSNDETTIEGTVVNTSNGSPLAGVLVSTNTNQSALTDASGNYSISNITPGLVQVNTFKATYGYESKLIDINSNTTQRVDFTIAIGAPRLIGSKPANNASQIKTDTTIELVFNQDMNIDTFNTTSFVVSERSKNISGSFIVSDNRTLLFTPDASLELNKNYAVTITTKLKNSTGLSMDKDVRFSFSTDRVPTPLVLSYPSDFNSTIGSTIPFTINVSDSNTIDKTITLSSDKATRIALPKEVILKAGEKTTTFEGVILDPGTVQKKVKANIYAKTSDYIPTSKSIVLNSVNIPEFELTLNPDTVSEGDGINATYATLKRTTLTDKEVIVSITVDQDDRLIIPKSIVFEEGEIEKTFNIGAIDNTIVEGDQLIIMRTIVWFLDCNCIDKEDITTITEQSITIIDNDGLTLTLAASPSTIKAGTLNNSLTIERNTIDPAILKNPVEVTLSSNLPTAILLPATVTIPADQKEVIVSFDTKIDASSSEDQNVRIEAKAENYNTGFAWVLITDQNKPDVVITELSLPDRVEAAKKINVITSILNQGYADFDQGAKLEYYLSPNNATNGIEPFSSSILPKGIKVGETYNFSEEIQLPVLSGELNFIAIVNRDGAINELVSTNNQKLQSIALLPSYTAEISLDKNSYKPGEKVLISGAAKRLDGTPVPIADVEITITNQGFSRSFMATTNANGSFVYEFTPLENESGIYSVTAAYPGATVAPQETFDILGFELLDQPKYIKWEPFVDQPLGKAFILKNNTSIALTGVMIKLPDNAGFELEQTPITIAAGQQATLNFNIISRLATVANEYQENEITIVSSEGAALEEIIYYYSKTKESNLVAEPITINTTMVKGATRLYEFVVKNIGDVAATDIEVLLPDLPWLSLRSPKIINNIGAGENAKIILELTPTEKEQLNVPISGTLVLKAANSKGTSVPFRIETVSDVIGSLVVDATDEYTYNTASMPHVSGAKVVVKLPYSDTIIAEGVTDADGLFEVPSINEGYYTVTVNAEKHNPYQNNILVDPGKTKTVNAFMQYQAVTYSWDVKPTEITDEYEVELITIFETNIPKPVIIMELDNDQLDLEEGESRLVNLTITNHGLIAANRVKLSTPDIPGYEIKLLIETMEVLNAKTTVVVPVVLKKIPDGVSNKRLASNVQPKIATRPCAPIRIPLEAYFICNGEEKIFSSAYLYTPRNCIPDGLATPNGPGSPRGDGTIGTVSGTFIVGTIIDICDPCTKKIISLALKYAGKKIPRLKYLGCLFDYVTATTNKFDAADKKLAKCVTPGLPKNPFTPKNPDWKKTISIVKDVLDVLEKCTDTLSEKIKAEKLIDNKQKIISNQSSLGGLDFIKEDFQKIKDAYNAQQQLMSEFLKNDALLNNEEAYLTFITEVADNIDNKEPFTISDVVEIKKNLKNVSITETYIDSFITRWNTTVEAWNKNIFSPNDQYPDIVDQIKISEYTTTKEKLVTHAFQRGFVSALEMYENGLNALDEYREEKSKDEASVCATVTIEFPQRITMTREAFEGTLNINNSSDKSIKDINLDVVVRDEFGEDKTNLFQINKDVFLNGTGMVAPDSKRNGVAVFIPTKAAAPELTASYSFGGVLSYFDEEIQERVFVTLNPVTLEVNPSPDLILDYFVQRDIISDDALTEDVVEPSIPAELSLMITNDGFGDARNVKVESTQPRIIDNEKGLAIDFNIIGSNFNNEPKQMGLLGVDFGDIEAKKSAVGQWFFTSSLLGKFVKYEVNVNHTSSFGNKELSLIKGSYVHELIKSVRAYQTGNDEIADFLVNDNADANDTPDRIFLSSGGSEEVVKASSVTSSNPIAVGSFSTTITIAPETTGWNYGLIEDPGGDQFKLDKIVRDSDGLELPTENFWQTFVTLKDGLNPKYENNLHVLDNITAVTTYTVSYVSKDQNTPVIVALAGAPDSESTQTAVQQLTVTFSKEIDESTFGTNNIKILNQGLFVPTDDIVITKVDATTYTLDITNLTQLSGFYQATISSIGVKDLLGNEGNNVKRAQWLQFLNELGILQFVTDQTTTAPINTIALTFNKQINTEDFTSDKITINGNPVGDSVVIEKVDDFNYTILGIIASNQENGSYIMSIDLPQITTIDGSIGLAVQSFEWIVDTNLPEIISLQPLSQGGATTQNITEIDIVINRKLSNKVEASALTFTKNGQEIDIPVTIVQFDDLNYKVLGLTDYTKDDGNYTLSIDQSDLRDENGNTGEGIAEASWTVKLNALIGLSNARITPDRGTLNTDNITAGDAIELVYETLEDNLTVEVYELLTSSEVLLFKNTREKAGEYRVPLKGKLGTKRFKLIASDNNGNKSNPEIVGSYIDFTNIVIEIKTIKEDALNDCYDFDSVEITFSEALVENTFTKDAISLTSSGIEISKDDVVLTKIDDRSYLLQNIQSQGDGLISLEIDKTKIAKKLSGFVGTGITRKTLGASNSYNADITGIETPNLTETYTYTASDNIRKYDWIIFNGEIISTSDNTVTVKWNVLGTQSLMLRYETPFGCAGAVVKNVVVTDGTLSIAPPEESKTAVTLTPVPNDGQFTIHTSKPLQGYTIDVYDVSGQIVYREEHVNINKNIKNIDITDIPSGMYILVIHNKKEKLNFRFVVR